MSYLTKTFFMILLLTTGTANALQLKNINSDGYFDMGAAFQTPPHECQIILQNPTMYTSSNIKIDRLEKPFFLDPSDCEGDLEPGQECSLEILFYHPNFAAGEEVSEATISLRYTHAGVSKQFDIPIKAEVIPFGAHHENLYRCANERML